jgi:glutathione S-transferase
LLRVLGKASSINVRKVLWTADELGLACQQEDWGTGFQPLDTPAFRRLNPNALVPVLVDGVSVLWESNTICRYLAASYPGPAPGMLPEAPIERARVEQWMDWQLGELNPAWRPAFMHLVRGVPCPADTLQASLAHWTRLMHLLDDQLAGTGAWVIGAQFTLADIVLGLSVNRWQLTPVSGRPELPQVAAWQQRLQARPAARRWAFNGTP